MSLRLGVICPEFMFVCDTPWHLLSAKVSLAVWDISRTSVLKQTRRLAPSGGGAGADSGTAGPRRRPHSRPRLSALSSLVLGLSVEMSRLPGSSPARSPSRALPRATGQGSGPWLILVLSWMQHELRAHGRRARRGEQCWRAGKRRFRPRLRSSHSFGSCDERWRPQQVAEGHCSRASLGRREQSTGGCRRPLARPTSPPRGAWPWYREGSGGRRPRAELRGGAVPTLQLCRLAASSTV